MIVPSASALTGALRRARSRRAVLVLLVVVLEGLWLAAFAVLLPQAVGGHAETPSPWAVILLTAAAYGVTAALGARDLPPARRRIYGAALTVALIGIAARVDLSESLRLWDFGWLSAIMDFDSEAWRQQGRLDHLFGVLALAAVWVRGAWLGGGDLATRGLSATMLFGFTIFILGLLIANDAPNIETLRILVFGFLATALAVSAFKNATRISLPQGGSLRGVGVTFLWTLVTTVGLVAIFLALFLLLASGLVALVAGSGAADPILDALSVGVEVVVKGIAWLFYPLILLLQWFVEGGPDDAGTIIEGLFPNEPPEDAGEQEPPAQGSGSPVGAILLRVFAGLGLLGLLVALAFLLFHRRRRRPVAVDEERESIWSESRLGDDLRAGWHALQARLTRPSRPRRAADAPIARLYFAVLEHAASLGLERRPAVTPLQFAPRLAARYASDVPREISRRFTDLRYAGRDSDPRDVRRLRDAWEEIKRARGP